MECFRQTIQKLVKIEKVDSIYLLGLVSCKIFYICKHLHYAKFLVDGKSGTCEFFVTCELAVVQNFWHVRSFGTWFKICYVQKFWHVQHLARAKVLARAKFGTCESFGTCKIWDLRKFWHVQKPAQFSATTQFGALHRPSQVVLTNKHCLLASCRWKG